MWSDMLQIKVLHVLIDYADIDWCILSRTQVATHERCRKTGLEFPDNFFSSRNGF